MKNLKKILSLTLALAMALSLMTVAFAKDTGDFADGDDVSYAEAVDVMATVGVFNGVGDGTNFDPKGNLTREQAAKIITYMIMGQTQADQLVATIAPFADVSADRWSAGAIAYCASENIMNGTGNGKFDPTGELTGLQFAKMLLGALGYDAEIEKMTGVAWGLATSKLAYEVGLNDGLGDDISLTNVLTREQAAQMALTTMKTPLVKYADKGTEISVNGAVVTFGAKQAEYVTTTIARTQTISSRRLSNSTQFTIEFAEKYCPKLELTPGTDAFGRPDYTWTYDKVEINNYVDYSTLYGEFTTEVTGKDLYDLLGKAIVENEADYDFEIYVNGETRYKDPSDASGVKTMFNRSALNRNNKAAIGGTGNGVLTQVFVDTDADLQTDKKTVTISVIDTYLAIAKADYNAKKDEVSFEVYGINGNSANDAYWKDTNNEKKTLSISGEDFSVAKDIKEDDAYLVNVAEGEIQIVAKAEVMADTTLSSFKKGENVVSDGTTYKYASTAKYDTEVLDDYTGDSINGVNLKDKKYNIYLDPYGYLIGVDLVTVADNYVFVTGVDSKTSNLSAKQYDANAIFMDGTMKTITFDNEKSTLTIGSEPALVNTWCTYTVNSNDIYTLKQVSTPAAADGAAPDEDGTSVSYKAGDSLVDLVVNNKLVKVGQYHDTADKKIDVKNVSLSGSGAAALGRKDFKYVYGNDDTVYLTASVKGIYTGANNTKERGVISKVSSVTTGVGKVSLDVLNETDALAQAKKNSAGKSVTVTTGNVAQGTYVLYKNNGYVIAAVTVADDSSSSENLVYAHTKGIEQEEYDQATDTWTWTRKVVHNGEEITLTEKGDGISVLKNMSRYNWYQVAYNAKGEVISSTHAVDELTTGSTRHEDDNKQLQTIINTAGVNTVLYEESAYNGYTSPSTCADKGDTAHAANEIVDAKGPNLKSNTFYARTDDETGFYVDKDVKVVFVQTNDNKTTVSIESGKDALENAVEDLNPIDGGCGAAIDSTKNNGVSACASKYHYEVSAVIESGVGKVVVIRDLHATGRSGNITPDTPNAGYTPTVDRSGMTLNVHANTNNDVAPEVYDAAVKWLNDNGYTITGNMQTATPNFTFFVKDGNGNSYTMNTNLVSVVRFNLNGENKALDAGTTINVPNYVVGNDADAVKGGAQNASAIQTTALTSVAWGMNGKYYRSDMISVNINSGTAKAYKAGDKVTGLTGNYYYVDTVSGAGTAIPEDGVEVTSAMSAGVDLKDGYYKVTQKGATESADKASYVKAGQNTTGLTLTGPFAKDTDGTVHAVTTNQIAMPAAANAKDITIANGEDVYYSVTPATAAANKNSEGLTYTMTAPSEVTYAKSGAKVTVTFTAKGTSTGTTAVNLAITGTGAKTELAASTPVTDGTGIDGFTSVATSADQTKVVITPKAGEVNATINVVVVVGTANVSFAF